MVFANREMAGKALGVELSQYRGDEAAVLYGLTRGGVVVASSVAEFLHLPLDCIVVQRVIWPGSKDVAIAAIAENGGPVSSGFLSGKRILKRGVDEKRREITRQQLLYRAERPAISAKDKISIVVDDGIATGLTMLAAVRYVRKQRAEEVVVATPTASRAAIGLLGREADQVVVLDNDFKGFVGRHYKSFGQTTDRQVIRALTRSTGTDEAGTGIKPDETDSQTTAVNWLGKIARRK